MSSDIPAEITNKNHQKNSTKSLEGFLKKTLGKTSYDTSRGIHRSISCTNSEKISTQKSPVYYLEKILKKMLQKKIGRNAFENP